MPRARLLLAGSPRLIERDVSFDLRAPSRGGVGVFERVREKLKLLHSVKFRECDSKILNNFKVINNLLLMNKF